MLKNIKILIDFKIDFFRIWAPTWPQLGLNLAPKTTQNPKSWLQKLVGLLPERASENDFKFQRCLGASWLRFGSVLGWILGPKTPPRLPRRPQEAHKTPPRRPQDAPKCHQDVSKTPLDAHKTSQDAPRTTRRPQDAPKTQQDVPKPPQDCPKRTNLPRTAENQAQNQAQNQALPSTVKNTRLHNAVLPNFVQIATRPNFKNMGRRCSPQGVFNPPDHLVVLGRAQNCWDNLSKISRNP